MGDPGTPEGTYIGMVRHNIDTIVAALAGPRSAGIGIVPGGERKCRPLAAMGPAIEVEDLTVAYREQPVLWDVDLECRPAS